MPHEQNHTHNISLSLGARGSTLSRWQANHVAMLLEKEWPNLTTHIEIITTKGDETQSIPLPQIGGKGVFTQEIEKALRESEIDVAIHSQKDLPVEDNEGVFTAAIPPREDPRDCVVSKHGCGLSGLPKGAKVGTSSTRRAAQIKHLRPDLVPIDIRGNMDTRIKKALDKDGPYDAIVVAYAGIKRLEMTHVVSEVVDISVMLPAPAQGALAVQCRAGSETLKYLKPINHVPTWLETLSERAFLKGLGGGCSLPVAALASFENGVLSLEGSCVSVDGVKKISVKDSATVDPTSPEASKKQALELGAKLAQEALSLGAAKLLGASL